MDEKWGRGDLVKLLFVKKAKYELNTDGWVGLQQMEKMEEAGSGEQGKWYKEMHFRQMGWDRDTARAKTPTERWRVQISSV